LFSNHKKLLLGKLRGGGRDLQGHSPEGRKKEPGPLCQFGGE